MGTHNQNQVSKFTSGVMWSVQYDDDWKRRDVLGIHKQRQEGLFWVGALVPVGRLQADDMDVLADVAERWVAAATHHLHAV